MLSQQERNSAPLKIRLIYIKPAKYHQVADFKVEPANPFTQPALSLSIENDIFNNIEAPSFLPLI